MYKRLCSPVNSLLQDECEKTGDIKDDNDNFNDDDDDDDGDDSIEEPKDELKVEINEEPGCLDIGIDMKHDENDS
jgi:hypothetical protein